MPTYKYIGGSTCRYGGARLQNGDCIEAGANPDKAMFKEVGKSAPAPKKEKKPEEKQPDNQ